MRKTNSPCVAFLMIAFSATLGLGQTPGQLRLSIDASGDRLSVHRMGQSDPILTHIVKADFRPYLHPIVAPDGKGLLTEFSPGHHRHQTGLYWGLTRVNGRDYFHHPEGTYWRRVSTSILKNQAQGSRDHVQWQTVYDLLDESGSAILRETQVWTLRDADARYYLDLQWHGHALVDVTVGQYDYGGLFIRMPWKPGLNGEVISSARNRNQRAEGQRAVWLDVGLQVEGRQDLAHITVFDHPQNSGFPQPWRVDGQLGIGPVRARMGDWRINKGQTEIVRHRMVIHTGDLDDGAMTREWSDFSGQGIGSIQWQVAQQEGRKAEFLTPEKAVAQMTLLEGFTANVFASEPMIGQPMAFCWDAKGRMWIAENRDYETRQTGFSRDGSSRILILEDTDRDGKADLRKVFLEDIPFPTAIAVGIGGLWLGAPPNLLFVPDRDGDDRGDVEAIQVRLTGWGIRDRHETLNSFLWGPDGWLYGLQGYATPSKVGKPAGSGRAYRHGEAFPEKIQWDGEPVDINGGVWRYHPTKDRFEVVAHGFSNPWGIDYDAHGQLFITACVIPHLWHVIPGGIYHRQGGTHFNPYVYADIQTITDHPHQSAHGGARIYQSDAFPEKYRGRIFMANIHEHAVLTDILEPKGSGFVGHHGDDFMLANNAQWVGFSLEVGPEGAVYALDWHDADICGKEVLNKDTGRVFRIAAKHSRAAPLAHRYADLNALDDLALTGLQDSPSAWHANQARTVLQHRAHQGMLSDQVAPRLRAWIGPGNPTWLRLRAIWTLHVIGSLTPDELVSALSNGDPYVRGWAVQLLCEDFRPESSALRKMQLMAQSDPSPVVRLYLAAAAQRVGNEDRWQLLESLSRHAQDQSDHNLPKMLWFGLEPLVTSDVERALRLAEHSRVASLSRSIARRLVDANRWEPLFEKVASSSSDARLSILLGIRDAIEGRFDLSPPSNWLTVYPKLEAAGGQVATVALHLSQIFGDAQAMEGMLATLRDGGSEVVARRQAVERLAGRRHQGLRGMLRGLLDDASLRKDAIRAVSAYDDVPLAKELLARYKNMNAEEKLETIHALSARSNYGQELTSALRDGIVSKSDIPAYVARVLRRAIGNRFVDVWGPIEELGADKESLLTRYRELLTTKSIQQADPARGRLVFKRSCLNCHRLHGEGGNVGPDITGANRGNLDYLLGNILTPSAIIQDAYRMHILLTEDGRIYSGIPVEEDPRQIRLRVADREEPVVLPLSQIQSRQVSPVSMMPDGLLANLQDSEVLDLIAYLQSSEQIAWPESR